jgi:predicted GNAT superfamily acetyltransferase
LASIAYLDGEKHVRVSMAMDTIMSHVSEHKNDSSLMYMCTPTDVYAVPEEVIEGSNKKFKHRSKFETVLSKGLQPFP